MASQINFTGSPQMLSGNDSLRKYIPDAEIQSFKVEANEGTTAPATSVLIETDDVIITRFENNTQKVHSGAGFIHLLQSQQPTARNSNDEQLILPQNWQEDNAPFNGNVKNALQLTGLDVVKNAGGKMVAEELAHLVEKHHSVEGLNNVWVNGKTSLSGQPNTATRSINDETLMPETELVMSSTEIALPEFKMGVPLEQKKIPEKEVKVFVTNGDLSHSLYPLVAGHFKGESLLEAERIIDRRLNNYLSIRHAANNYPGEIGTHEIIFHKNSKPTGAIIVGLGEYDAFTEIRLTQTLKQALLAYIIKCREDQTVVSSTKELGISYLLVGSGFGGLPVSSSIKAILNAVKETNLFFDRSSQIGYQRIEQVEIIELFLPNAIEAGRTLISLFNHNQLFQEFVFKPKVIKKASGARNEIPYEMKSGWWQRIKITQLEETLGTDLSKVTRSIIFSSLTDKARNEEVVLSTNISIVDKLIEQAAAVSNNNPLLCQTLFELLVPNAFKGYGSDLRSLVLVLDKETARYPWEMMLDANTDNKEPFVTKTGFIRQLSTATYRENTRFTSTNNALVIGNPQLNQYYPALPGASIEAGQISDILNSNGYTVKPFTFIESNASDILPHLFTQPFKILHIAAHGVLNDKRTGRTGVVLGEEIILTPADFEQLRNVPELVFINCCSLGAIDKTEEENLQRKYKVAAGIGTQLIEMGVKAVIVAGWEVDDGAALCFSEHFYREMLSGSTYGDAVKLARSVTYQNYPQKNTWGAYQCYGDPFYTLRVIENGITKNYQFCDAVEVIHKLQNLISEIEAASSRDEKVAIKSELEAIIKVVDDYPEWKGDAQILEQLAELYKELGEYDEAITYYDQLFSSENANYTVHTVEQYCNIRVKQAFKEYRKAEKTLTADSAMATTAATVISEMITTLKNLNLRPTSERLNLIASAYRRLADVNSSDEKMYLENLVTSAGFYQQGFDRFYAANGKAYYYPLYNWLIISAVVSPLMASEEGGKYKSALTLPENLEQLMTDASAYAAERDLIKPGFWNKTADSMQNLFRLVVAQTEDEIERNKTKIVENHIRAWETEGTVNKKNAIGEHIQFISGLLATYGAKMNGFILRENKIAALSSLNEALA